MEKIIFSLSILIFFICVSYKNKFNSLVNLFSIMSLVILVYYSFFQKNYAPFSDKFDIFYSSFLLLFFISYLLFFNIYKYGFITNKNTLQKNDMYYIHGKHIMRFVLFLYFIAYIYFFGWLLKMVLVDLYENYLSRVNLFM
jgi:hypothetical protein